MSDGCGRLWRGRQGGRWGSLWRWMNVGAATLWVATGCVRIGFHAKEQEQTDGAAPEDVGLADGGVSPVEADREVGPVEAGGGGDDAGDDRDAAGDAVHDGAHTMDAAGDAGHGDADTGPVPDGGGAADAAPSCDCFFGCQNPASATECLPRDVPNIVDTELTAWLHRATTDLVLPCDGSYAVELNTDTETIPGCSDFGVVFDTQAQARPGTYPAGVAPPDLRIMVVNSLRVRSGSVVTVRGDKALVIVARETVVVNGTIDVSALQKTGQFDRGRFPGPGGWAYGEGPGAGRYDGSTGAGAGGGGFGAPGGHGGSGVIPLDTDGPSYGGGEEPLIPLVGGSGGGVALDSGRESEGGAGGGALQIVAGQSLRVGASGGLKAAGGGGDSGGDFGGGGGGSGGALLLMAPLVVMEGVAAANGGGGGGCGNTWGIGQLGQLGQLPAQGDTSRSVHGGTGGAAGGEPAGGDGGYSARCGGGGGGGAVGRVRVIAGESDLSVGTWSPAPGGIAFSAEIR